MIENDRIISASVDPEDSQDRNVRPKSLTEYIGQQPECVEFILDGLKDRGVIYNETIEELS